ncbi:MAG: Cas10/Cmr2 second palm domain-containing protein [Candidatus Cryosericum sp.]
MECYLVVLETSGNQAYVFATNKLKENVGASELTRRAGTEWVLEAVARQTGRQSLYRDDPVEQKKVLINPALNPHIETEGAMVEVVEAISGKAILLVKDEKAAKAIVQHVTQKALDEAPGIDVKGAVAGFEWNEPGSVAKGLKKAYRRYEELRTSMHGPESRFLRLPFVAECASSGMPAAGVDKDGVPVSLQTVAKREPAKDVHDAVSRQWAPEGWTFAYNLDKADWMAVVHADGNGLGQVFMNFENYCGSPIPVDNRKYVDTLRRFSCAVDVCTHKAFKEAVNSIVDIAAKVPQDKMGPRNVLPLRPLVLGGDDMTVACDAQLVMSFVKKYLEQFEVETACDEDTKAVAARMTHGDMANAWLSAGAGIAIVKSHYPFYAAYNLAEELASRAKNVVKEVMRHPNGGIWPCSTVDFHVLHDSSATELDEIRRKLRVDDGVTLLYGTPYVITPSANFEQAPLETEQKAWLGLHAWGRLTMRADVLREKDEDGRRILPNSQIHELRASLFKGRGTADAALQLIEHRYAEAKISKLLEKPTTEGEHTLFALDRKDTYVTLLLDAMEAEAFLPTENDNKTKGASNDQAQ